MGCPGGSVEVQTCVQLFSRLQCLRTIHPIQFQVCLLLKLFQCSRRLSPSPSVDFTIIETQVCEDHLKLLDFLSLCILSRGHDSVVLGDRVDGAKNSELPHPGTSIPIEAAVVADAWVGVQGGNVHPIHGAVDMSVQNKSDCLNLLSLLREQGLPCELTGLAHVPEAFELSRRHAETHEVLLVDVQFLDRQLDRLPLVHDLKDHEHVHKDL
mmetsp:Transcript_42795/g.91812  ORF Transcript_42795/g.91812 Transcript_42795/m.91812 type:complete len:211 (+) Transcript_42795:785-1417(+)